MALTQPTPLPFPQSEGNEFVFQPKPDDLVVEFAQQFTQLQGKFIFCGDERELIENFEKLCQQNHWKKVFCAEAWRDAVPPGMLNNDVSTCDASLTSCEVLIARTGSIVLSSLQQGRVPSVYAPVHVCVAYASQLVYDIGDGLAALTKKYNQNLPSLITFATGPSRTADIEKTLVVGVHGPKEVYCFLIDDNG